MAKVFSLILLSITSITESMELNYSLSISDQKCFVYLYDPPQRLDADEVKQWMAEVRDDQPDLYALLVRLYFMMTKSNYTKETE